MNALQSNPVWMMVYGHGEHIDEAGKVIERYPSRSAITPIEEFSHGCFICQPTVFFKLSMNILLGALDESLKTAFDFEYWLRAFYRLPGQIGFIDAVQAQSRLHAECITLKMRGLVAIEGMRRHAGRA